MGERVNSGPAPSTASDKSEQRQRRGEARPDGEGEHVDLARGLGQHIAGPQKNDASTTRRKGPKLAPATRAEPMTAMPTNATARRSTCIRLRPFAKQDPGQRDREERLRLDDQRGEPDREALMDRDEQEAELADADQEAVDR